MKFIKWFDEAHKNDSGICNSFITVKKIIAIFLILLYSGSAFGFEIDCNNCKGKKINFSTYGNAGGAGKTNRNDTNRKIISCKTDNHEKQVAVAPLSQSFDDYVASYVILSKLNLSVAETLKQYHYYYSYRQSKSTREFLFFIHILRI